MNMNPKPQRTLLALCVTHLLVLTACGGGGGGSGGMVRSDPPAPVVPPPPPVAAQPCPAPVSTDCAVTTGATMLGGRASNHALAVRLPIGGGLILGNDDPSFDQSLGRATYTFAGGTAIEGGQLYVRAFNTLRSEVEIGDAAASLKVAGTIEGRVLNRGHLAVWGTVVGNVTNHGAMEMWGFVTGDVANHGSLMVGSSVYYSEGPYNRIEGNFRQAATGTLHVAIPVGDFFGSLQIRGRADIEGGTLQLHQYGDAWGPYPLPTAPLSALVLHADGGVFGQFARWTSPGLFVEGSVRYGSNDVWFDLTRLSLQSAMAANAAADPLTLASAANIDAALSQADGYALAPSASLDASQQRFLASAASILYSRDAAHATRTLDSLSGHAHARAQDALHGQATASAMQLDAHLHSLRHDPQARAWSRSLTGGARGHVSGVDQWLSPRLLVGGSVTSGWSRMQFERMGGQGQGESPMASMHAHYRNSDWHATGLVGAARTVLQLDRPIDLGAAGTHVAHSRREFAQAFLHGELGRRIVLGRGRLTPFVALDYSALHGEGFVEQGDTGFELAAQSARSTQWSASAGARYARDWRLPGNGWLRLDLDARYQQHLADDGDALQAAFTGAPDVLFDLPSWSRPGHGAAVTLGLTGGMDDRWAWSLDYARRFGGDPAGDGWFVGLRRDF